MLAALSTPTAALAQSATPTTSSHAGPSHRIGPTADGGQDEQGLPDSAEPGGAELVLEGVRVETGRPPLLDVESSSTVIKIPQGQLGDQSVADYLDSVPGVQILSHGTSGQSKSVTIRGSDSRQVLVLVEGFSVVDPQSGGVDLSLIPIEAVEQIEVYRGAAGALAGQGAMGGVVVVRLRKGGGAHNALSLSTGSFGAFSTGLTARSEDFLLTYSHNHQEGDFPYIDTNGSSRVRENNASASDRLTASWSHLIWRRARLDTMVTGGSTWRQSPGLEQFPSTLALEQRQNVTSGLRLTIPRFPASLVDSRLSAAWSFWMWRFVDPAPYFPPPSDTRSTNGRLIANLDNTFRLAAFMSLDTNLTAVGEWVDTTRSFAVDVEKQRALGDAAGELSLGKNDWPVTGKVRARLAFSDTFATKLVPGAEVTGRLPADLALTVAFNRGYRYPSFDELYFESSGIRGDPTLGPEKMWGGECRLAWVPTNGFSASAAVFQHWIEETILFLPKTPYLITAQNTGPVTGRGVEAEASFRNRWVDLGIAGSWLNVRSDTSSKELPQRPEWTGSLTLKLSPVTWGELFAQVRYSDSFWLDRFNSRFEEPRVGLDAGIAGRVTGGFRLSVDFRNLLNKRDSIDSFQYPLPGFAWMVTLQKQWANEQGEER